MSPYVAHQLAALSSLVLVLGPGHVGYSSTTAGAKTWEGTALPLGLNPTFDALMLSYQQSQDRANLFRPNLAP